MSTTAWDALTSPTFLDTTLRPRTGGLAETLSRRCFPELWSVRTKL